MSDFFATLKHRNEALFFFGLVCLIGAIFCLVLTRFTSTQVLGINAWIKPMKFFLSTTLYCWTIAWYVHYLGQSVNVSLFNWVVILALGFELVYISLQAAKGQLSHFNISSVLYANLFSLMAVAATVVSIYTAFIAWKFFSVKVDLPLYYLWSIRIALILFVIFSLQGFMMGGRLAHTVGAPDGSDGLPILNWSKSYGDLRIAHFIGMHALQVIPLLSWYLLKNVRYTLLLGVLYGVLASYSWIQAIQGKPMFRF